MNSLYFLFPTLLAILVSFLFVRAASIALMMTGLAKPKARFQALSAFSGTGFTTREAESIVNHPQRRKIVRWLMMGGNAGHILYGYKSRIPTPNEFIYSHYWDFSNLQTRQI